MEPERYTVMTVGESQTGKTCLSIGFQYDRFPTEGVPSVNGVYTKDFMVHAKMCHVTVHEDAPHDVKRDRTRQMNYPEVNTFIALFSVDKRESFECLKNRWIPELQAFEPKTPILIVANKIELRSKDSHETVSFGEGFGMAKELGTSYREISCKELSGITECYKHAIELAMLNAPKVKEVLKISAVFIPPLLPPKDPEPIIKRDASTFSTDWLKFINSKKYHDVIFILEGEKHIYSHRVFLCSVSSFFRKVFLTNITSKTESIDSFNIDDLNSGKIPGIQRVYEERGELTVELTPDIKADTFSNALTFIYSGSIPQNLTDLELSALRQIAQTFEMPGLVLQCNSEEYDEENLNSKQKGPAISEFLKQDLFSDFVFNIKGTKIPAHRVVVSARSEAMAKKLADMSHMYPGIKIPAHKMALRTKDPWETPMADPRKEEEDPRLELPVSDHSVEVVAAFLEYAYTDDVHFDESIDACAFGCLSDHMWNYHMSKVGEVQIRKDVEDMVNKLEEGQLLDIIELHKKFYMMSWSVHYIGTHYNEFESFLDEDNKPKELRWRDIKSINHHRWPPLHYSRQVEDFEKDLKKANLFSLWQN